MEQYIRQSIPNSLKMEVFFLDNFTCVYCGIHQPNQSIDHRLPVSLGGPTIIQNLVTCCLDCNRRKNDRADYECGIIATFGRFANIKPEFGNKPKKGKYLNGPIVHRSRPVSFTKVPLDKNHVIELFNSGMAVYKIAKQLGGNYQTRLYEIRAILNDVNNMRID